MLTQPAPKPGIYPGVSFAEYLSWDAISNTSLHAAARSMAHYRKRKPATETRPMILGTLTHSAQFEASYVNDRYAFMPDYAGQVQQERIAAGEEPFERPSASKPCKTLVKKFLEAHADKVIICEQEFTDLVGMVRSLSNDRRARGFLTGGQYEVSIVAVDPQTGLTCKGRVDHLAIGRVVADLKTTQDASEFEKSISNWSYHRQLALYGDMLEWIDPAYATEQRAIVVVESADPYCVRSAPLDEDALETGREEYRELLDAIAVCTESKAWPGYANPDKWRLPHWHGNNYQPVNLVVAETT